MTFYYQYGGVLPEEYKYLDCENLITNGNRIGLTDINALIAIRADAYIDEFEKNRGNKTALNMLIGSKIDELTHLLKASFVLTYKLYDGVVHDSVSLTDGVMMQAYVAIAMAFVFGLALAFVLWYLILQKFQMREFERKLMFGLVPTELL